MIQTRDRFTDAGDEPYNEPMLCPNDDLILQPVKVQSHYGQTVLLDQCPKCGGIWFDSYELFMAKQGQAERIDLVDIKALSTPSPMRNQELHCPRDHSRLVHYSDRFWPKDIIVARCPTCGGYWLNRGEFVKYQKYRQSLKKPEVIIQDNDKLAEAMKRLLDEHKHGDAVDTLGRLGRFLSTPIDSLTWQPLEPEQASQKERTLFNQIIDLLSLVLRIFVRV